MNNTNNINNEHQSSGPPCMTLREQAFRLAALSEREWVRDMAGVLASCQTLDATEVFTYFWDETPPEASLRMRDLGRLELPEALRGSYRGKEALFVETRAPGCGLAWSLVFDGAGVASGTKDLTAARLSAAACRQGVPAMLVGSERAVMAFEPGLVESAGALVYLDRAPFGRLERRFYRRMADRGLVRGWAGVAQVMPFVKLKADAGGAVIGPQVVYYMPLDRDGRVCPLGSGEELPMVIPDAGPGVADQESLGFALMQGHRPLQLGLVFSLACCSAPVATGAGVARLAPLPKDGCGLVSRLEIEDLKADLDDRGGAREFSISRAMTVCRDSFGGAPADLADAQDA